MGKVVVAKLYRLGRDGDKVKEEYKTELRSRVVIDEDDVIRFNAGKEISAQMYVIDKAATKERNQKIIGEKAEKAMIDNKKKEAEQAVAAVINSAISATKKKTHPDLK